MNDRLLEILAARRNFPELGDDRAMLDIFCEYLDRSSLFLAGFEPTSEGPVFIFTNEAERFRFSIAEMRELVRGMKHGKPFGWESVGHGN